MERLRRILIRLLKPLSVFTGNLYIAPHQRAIEAAHVFELEYHLKAGDVLLTYSRGEITNYLIEGEYKHCAMYIGNGKIIEAIRRGVTVRDFDDFAASKDKIAICRAIFCTEKEAENAAKHALTLQGLPYDYYFEPQIDAFYCAELVAHSYAIATGNTSPFVPRTIMGVPSVLPSDFKLASKKFMVIKELPHG